ncbi:MAG: DUF4270 domain-containing protein [Bacteroidales bacterium]|nr:DUF4270 domain-containing protein [Bacteroidales bacterium]
MMLRASLPNNLLLFAALFLSSCITIDKTLGDNLIPVNQDLTLKFQIFDLPIDTKPTDSLPTNNHFFVYDYFDMSLILGACQDPLFGLTTAGAVFQFIPRSTFSYGDHPEPLSLTLTLPRKNIFVLDNSQVSIPQNVFVHQVTSELTKEFAYNNSLLPKDFDPQPINQSGQVYFGSDTLSIALSLDYARELLTATQEERDSLHLFLKRFNGLYLRTELPRAGVNTGRLNHFPLDGFSSQMVLKYRLNGADSVIYYSPFPSGIAFNTIAHSNASLDPHPSENIYYQGFAGPKPYIDFVALVSKIKTWSEQSQIDVKNLLISRAEILLSYDPVIDFRVIDQYPLQLYPFTRVQTDSTSYYNPIENIYAPNSDGMINRSKFHYSMVITSYLQSLLKKAEVTEQDNAWLM